MGKNKKKKRFYYNLERRVCSDHTKEFEGKQSITVGGGSRLIALHEEGFLTKRGKYLVHLQRKKGRHKKHKTICFLH